MKNYTKRFSVTTDALVKHRQISSASQCKLTKNSFGRAKSRSGCLDCRQSRVKCDEDFPVCGRCTRRGTVCRSVAAREQWRMEVPGVTLRVKKTSPPTIANVSVMYELESGTNKKLLQHWFERTCQIFVLDLGSNPLSYSISEHLITTISLLHIVQSVSAAHQHFFNISKLGFSFEERSRALAAVRKELISQQRLHYSYLTVYLLGISASFIDNDVLDFGKEHLLGARTMLDMILSDPKDRANPLTHFITGSFIYWDMCCSFLVEPTEQRPINTPLIYSYIQEMSNTRHPITGLSTELFYLLCFLGRYIREIVKGGSRDVILEITIEQQLEQWGLDYQDPFWTITGDAFRKQGLITIYRFCGRHDTDIDEDKDYDEEEFAKETEELIHQYAIEIIQALTNIPINSSYIGVQPIPLLIAGAELTSMDQVLREKVKSRFRVLYSFNRIPGHLRALELLEGLWKEKDGGSTITWLEFMLRRNWRLRIG